MQVNQSGLHNIPSRKVIDHYSAGFELEVLHNSMARYAVHGYCCIRQCCTIFLSNPTYYHSVQLAMLFCLHPFMLSRCMPFTTSQITEF